MDELTSHAREYGVPLTPGRQFRVRGTSRPGRGIRPLQVKNRDLERRRPDPVVVVSGVEMPAAVAEFFLRPRGRKGGAG